MRKNRLRRRKSRNNSSRKSRWAIRFTFFTYSFYYARFRIRLRKAIARRSFL